jgi:transposase
MTLSLVLRERIADAHSKKLGTYEIISEFIGCGVATVSRVLRRKRETGSVNSKPPAGGIDAKIDEQGLKMIMRWLEKHSDMTLEELTRRYNSCSSTNHVSRATMGRAVRDRLGLSRKKKPIGQRKEIGRMSSKREKNIKTY